MEANSIVSGPGLQSKGLRKTPKRFVQACLGFTDLFYGDYSDLREEPQDEKLERETKAKQICETCEIIRPCRTYALQREEEYGVWGGMTPGERREFNRWFKTYYPNVSLWDEERVEKLIERWKKRHRKRQTKAESQEPRYFD